MKFRAKIFLAILLPATLLVAAVVGSALSGIKSQMEKTVSETLGRTTTALTGTLKDQFDRLEAWKRPFQSPRFDAAITEAAESGEVGPLKERLRDEFLVVQEPDFYEARGKKDEILLRKSPIPNASRTGVPPLQPWMKDETKKSVLTAFDGEPFLAVKVEPDKGLFILGTHFRQSLDKLRLNFQVDIALSAGESVVYSSIPSWTPAMGSAGALHLEGKRYLARSISIPESVLAMHVFLFDTTPYDNQRTIVMSFGIGGLVVAILIGGLVSSFISRGISHPVEQLVDAARKVATGDYGVKVDVSGRDEIGRLGEAFNEMTVGLRKRQEIMDMTLSHEIAEEFLRGGTERGGERRVITIVFMDIRGYTSGTEGMDPADVVVMLNELMDLLAAAIERHGGLVNKFLGDGLMAMFGAPKILENHALHAVEAAIEMQKQMERWNHRRTARGLHSFFSGIGINTGEVVCGKVGGRNRLEYTLIGEEVNLTSRICGKAAPRQVLITKSTRDLVRDRIQVKELEPVVVKGLSYPIKVFEALG